MIEPKTEPRIRLSARDMSLAAIFVALITAGCFIRVPLPVIPFTLQFLFTTLAGMILGPRLGTISVATYVALGLLGLPVFTAGGGPAYVLQPSFGYLLGFILGTWLTGRVTFSGTPSMRRLVAAALAGMAVVYALGLVYVWLISHFYLGTNMSLWSLFLYGFFLAAPGDVMLSFLAAAVALRLKPALARHQTKV